MFFVVSTTIKMRIFVVQSKTNKQMQATIVILLVVIIAINLFFGVITCYNQVKIYKAIIEQTKEELKKNKQ